MKKNYLFLLFLISFYITLTAQDFGKLGTEWHYDAAGGLCPGNCDYTHFSSVLDTVINGQSVHKITRTQYTRHGDTIPFNSYYFYEQSDTVFAWSFPRAKFLPAFIFNGNIGDTLALYAVDTTAGANSSYRLVIDTIINVVVDGIALKKYVTNSLDHYGFVGGFMDRIGGFLDQFLPYAGGVIPEAGFIRCYSDGLIDSSFQSVACDYLFPTTAIDDFLDNDEIKIYPNPLQDLLRVASPYPIENLALLDLSGRTILTSKMTEIDLSGLKHGHYILAIKLVSGQLIYKKVAKSTY